MTHDTLTIPTRYRGPARSGNGGWTCGSLAERVRVPQPHGSRPAPGPHLEVPPTVEVTLRRPPPLDTPLTVHQLAADDPDNPIGAPLTVLADADARVAEARVVELDLEPVPDVAPETAERAMAGYRGLVRHPFPSCFACGPDRADGDGLRIFPGPLPEGAPDTVASLWVPHPSLAESTDLLDEESRVGVGTTWAALDCVGGWSEDLENRPMVLGRMTARVDALPVVGETHVVVGRRLGTEGRKTFTASTLYDRDGRVVATAAHVWVRVDPSAFE